MNYVGFRTILWTKVKVELLLLSSFVHLEVHLRRAHYMCISDVHLIRASQTCASYVHIICALSDVHVYSLPFIFLPLKYVAITTHIFVLRLPNLVGTVENIMGWIPSPKLSYIRTRLRIAIKHHTIFFE